MAKNGVYKGGGKMGENVSVRMHKPYKPRRDRQIIRRTEIMQKRNAGWTYQEIGNHYGITKQRAYQIVHTEWEDANGTQGTE